ncbi:MAG: S1 RNA-binding domain-containing protein [Candidatus Magasanikbacteria bacterium]|jgi:small subunit ribosomal protein S1
MTDAVKNTVKQDFKTLLAGMAINVPKVGEVIKGKVISVDRGEVRLDVEGVTTGVVRGRELFVESREYAGLKVGDSAEATVVDLENENGEMELSFRIAGYQRAWDSMKKWMKDGLTLKAKVVSANKGGLMMRVDALSGFMPVSQLSPDNYPRVTGGDKNRILDKLREMQGKEFEVKVIDVDEKEEKLIVSERAVWEDSQKAVLETYKIGDVVSGEISALTSFGAFVKFGDGLEGLIHISEIAWQRIDHPKDVLKVGDQVKAQIIQLDHSKIYLSIKRLVDDPWKKVKEKYKMGDKVTGKIIKVEPFGLMIALDKEIHGLAHISELSDDPISNIHDKFKLGQELEFEVVSVEPAEHRLGLKVAGVKGKLKKEDKKDEAKKEEVKEEKKEEVKAE